MGYISFCMTTPPPLQRSYQHHFFFETDELIKYQIECENGGIISVNVILPSNEWLCCTNYYETKSGKMDILTNRQVQHLMPLCHSWNAGDIKRVLDYVSMDKKGPTVFFHMILTLSKYTVRTCEMRLSRHERCYWFKQLVWKFFLEIFRHFCAKIKRLEWKTPLWYCPSSNRRI